MICQQSTVPGYELSIPAAGPCLVDLEVEGRVSINIDSSYANIYADIVDAYGNAICYGKSTGRNVVLSNCLSGDGMAIRISQSGQTTTLTSVNYNIYPICDDGTPEAASDIWIGIFIGVVCVVGIMIVVAIIGASARRRRVAIVESVELQDLKEDGE